MEFTIMPDHLYGASVRISGKWLGIVDERPLAFTLPDQGTYQVLVELSPLRGDPSGEVHPLPLARRFQIQEGNIVPHDVFYDGSLHIRRTGHTHALFFIYPKTAALGFDLHTLPLLSQTETADFDRDGRLDTAEVLVTDRAGYVRVRSAQGTLLMNDVYPDPKTRIEVADITRDGRPDLLIFWRDPLANGCVGEAKMMLWESADGALSCYSDFTGVRRNGRGDVLVEREKATPFRQVIDLLRYSRKSGESGQFERVKTEEHLVRRADDEEDTVEAFLSSLEIGDFTGAQAYLARGCALTSMKPFFGRMYAHEINPLGPARFLVSAFDWIVPDFYDMEKKVRVDLVQQPDKVSEWKIAHVEQQDSR